MRKRMRQSNIDSVFKCGKTTKGYCVGLGFSVWCIYSKVNVSASRIRVR